MLTYVLSWHRHAMCRYLFFVTSARKISRGTGLREQRSRDLGRLTRLWAGFEISDHAPSRASPLFVQVQC